MILEFTDDDIPSEERTAEVLDQIESSRQLARVPGTQPAQPQDTLGSACMNARSGRTLTAPSIAAERFHGIDRSGAAGRDDARKDSPPGESRTGDGIREWI